MPPKEFDQAFLREAHVMMLYVALMLGIGVNSKHLYFHYIAD
jgi:hypothetical protein